MEGFENDSADIKPSEKGDFEALFESSFKDPKKGGIQGLKEDFTESQDGKIKTDGEKGGGKSSLRLKYEAEVQVIKKSCGDLEAIRRQLGLSKRKMSQLLLVDPSAWTRWTSDQGQAPPHIYRALQWYLILQDKHPELKSSLWLNAVATPQLSEKEVGNLKKELFQELKKDWAGQMSMKPSPFLKMIHWLEARPKALQLLLVLHLSVLFFLVIFLVSS